jgi:hypothetical protein
MAPPFPSDKQYKACPSSGTSPLSEKHGSLKPISASLDPAFGRAHLRLDRRPVRSRPPEQGTEDCSRLNSTQVFPNSKGAADRRPWLGAWHSGRRPPMGTRQTPLYQHRQGAGRASPAKRPPITADDDDAVQYINIGSPTIHPIS